jgi:hypothetical protein
VIEAGGDLARLDPEALAEALHEGRLRFHRGRIRGAVPQLSG